MLFATMDQLPTLPRPTDVADSCSRLGRTSQFEQLNVPALGPLDPLHRSGIGEDLPPPTNPFLFKDGVPHRVEPLPAPLS